jgi:integrase
VEPRLGEHVLRSGQRTVIVIDEADVKNGVGHDYPIPKEAVRLLDIYTEHFLPMFGHNPKRFLFPGKVIGRPKSPEQFGRFFTKTILSATGLKVYPHLLRHFAATIYLTENPEAFTTQLPSGAGTNLSSEFGPQS